MLWKMGSYALISVESLLKDHIPLINTSSTLFKKDLRLIITVKYTIKYLI